MSDSKRDLEAQTPVPSSSSSSISPSITPNATVRPDDDEDLQQLDEKHRPHAQSPSPSHSPSRSKSEPRLKKGLAEEDEELSEEEFKKRFEVTLEESEDPLNRPKLEKWACVGVVATCATCVTCASSMSSSTFTQISHEFHVGTEVAILSLSLFILGLGFGPLIFGGLSEFLGRNLIYRTSFAAFCLLTFPVAFANNIAVHLIFRFLTGFAGAAFLSVGGGTIADLFHGHQVATPVAIYSLSPFIGPTLGPVVAGFINQYSTWRWTYYVLIIWSFLEVVLLMLMPETYAPTLINRKAERLRKETGDERYYSPFDTRDKSLAVTLKLSIYRPFLLMTHEMMILLLNIWTSLLLAIVYITFSEFSILFGQVHHFSEHQVGLTFIGLGIGMVGGTSLTPFFNKNDRKKVREAEERGEKPAPEIALYPAMFAAVLAPVGLYMFAFTVYPQVHWIAPIICLIPFGMAVVQAFTSTFTYLVRVYRPMAASALASNSFMRSVLAGALPLASRPMFEAMTNTGALAFLAGVLTLMAPLPFIFFKFGPRIRRNSKYAV